MKSDKTKAYEASLRQWSNLVRTRDENICQRCFKLGVLAHHLAERSLRPDLALDVTNGTCLCWNCHTTIHDNVGESIEQGWLLIEAYEKRENR